MQVSVEHKIFSIDTISKFRKWFDDLLVEAYEAVKGTDVLIESPSTFAGVHIAEAVRLIICVSIDIDACPIAGDALLPGVHGLSPSKRCECHSKAPR